MVLANLASVFVAIVVVVIFFLIIKGVAIKHPPRNVKLGFCPKCGSQNILVVNKNFAMFYPTPTKYRCEECDFEGAVLPEAHNEEELLKIQRKLEKNR